MIIYGRWWVQYGPLSNGWIWIYLNWEKPKLKWRINLHVNVSNILQCTVKWRNLRLCQIQIDLNLCKSIRLCDSYLKWKVRSILLTILNFYFSFRIVITRISLTLIYLREQRWTIQTFPGCQMYVLVCFFKSFDSCHGNTIFWQRLALYFTFVYVYEKIRIFCWIICRYFRSGLFHSNCKAIEPTPICWCSLFPTSKLN